MSTGAKGTTKEQQTWANGVERCFLSNSRHAKPPASEAILVP